ncbi:MAG: DUF5683 domain-containing protein [Bacteroidota bacterium]
MKYLFIILFVILQLVCKAQTDSVTVITRQATIKPKKHSPKTATFLSLALPGAGQIYNRKNWWWKVPVIYGGGVALAYGIGFYNRNYNDFRDAYKYRIENNVDQNDDPKFDRYQTPTLLAIRESYRESRDLFAIYMVALYALQVVDAAVEAHFFDFNVTDDLSLNIQPSLNPGPYGWAGVQFNLKLK